MNILYLNDDPFISAKMMTDKHIVKMTLESAQLLCTAHRVLDGKQSIQVLNKRKKKIWVYPDSDLDSILYKATHVNHPCSIWTRSSKENYFWLYDHFTALCREYTFRYGKVHLCEKKLLDILKTPPINISNEESKEQGIATPKEYYSESKIDTYRAYYENEKLKKDSDINRYYMYI